MGTYLTKGVTFASGDTVTHTNLNNLVDNATFTAGGIGSAALSANASSGVITGNTSKGAPALTDLVLLHDASANTLHKSTVGSLGGVPAPWTTTLNGNDFELGRSGSGDFKLTSGMFKVGADYYVESTGWTVQTDGTGTRYYDSSDNPGAMIYSQASASVSVVPISGTNNITLNSMGPIVASPSKADESAGLTVHAHGASWSSENDAHDHIWSMLPEKTGGFVVQKSGGGVGVDEKIKLFAQDGIELYDNNPLAQAFFKASNALIVVNDTGLDTDFRVNGNGVVSIIQTDAATSAVTIGKSIFYQGGHVKLLPVSTAALNALSSPPEGSIAYCTDGNAGADCLAVRDSSGAWKRIALGTAIATS
tara:strand:- start:15087 stop:16178 length:1092 start_codon:yes stop_codon:yes gene_type:complete